ncbi:MAG: DUF1570 domain-containing protein [Parasphingorhabdus sp.]
MRFLFCLAVSIFLFSQPAHAVWHKAEGEHFVIYANQKASTVKLFAERLENFHAALAYIFDKEPESPSESNRITIFVVNSTANVRKLGDLKSKYAAGVYLPSAGNIVAIVPSLKSGASKRVLGSDTILRHEYAHHFLFNVSNRSFPLWFQEGMAEFFASARHERNGTVVLGAPAFHRAHELAYSNSVPIDLLLNTSAYLSRKSKRYDQFYGRSWLLYHYLTFDQVRKGQLDQYQYFLRTGSSEMDAAKEAFGDLKTLEKELDRYATQRRSKAFGIPLDRLKTKPVSIRRLNKGEAAMMPVIMESRTGIDDDDEAIEVVAEARKIAMTFPDNPTVMEALAEAEFDAGYDDQAIAAADKALALDNSLVRAQIQKIYAFARKAKTAEDTELAWKGLRRQIVVANRLETNHPIPLIEYYKSYRASGKPVPDIAKDGLYRALQLAPFDQGLRMTTAAQYIEDHKFQAAATTLRPLAYSPHRNDATQAAEQLLELAEKEAARAAKEPQQVSNSTSNAQD